MCICICACKHYICVCVHVHVRVCKCMYVNGCVYVHAHLIPLSYCSFHKIVSNGGIRLPHLTLRIFQVCEQIFAA